MYELKEKTKRMAGIMLGVSYDQYVSISYDGSSLRSKTTKFAPETDARIIGRGNPLLARNEFLLMEEVDKVLGEV